MSAKKSYKKKKPRKVPTITNVTVDPKTLGLTVATAAICSKPRLKTRTGQKMRSNPERWLYSANLDALVYEPEKFTLNIQVNYVPDFYCYAKDTWVEVKGRLNVIDLKKIVAFAVDHNIVVCLQKPNVLYDTSRVTTIETKLTQFGIRYFYVNGV